MIIKVVAWQQKMFVELPSFRAVDVVAVRIYSFVGSGFTLPYVLRFGAEGAVAQVDQVHASAVKVM